MSLFAFRRSFTNVPTVANCFRKFSTEKVPKKVFTNQTSLIDSLATETGVTKSSIRKVLSALPGVVREALKTSDGVKLHKIVTIRHSVNAARQMTNIHTKEKFDVPERQTLKGRISPFLKEV